MTKFSRRQFTAGLAAGSALLAAPSIALVRGHVLWLLAAVQAAQQQLVISQKIVKGRLTLL